MANRHAQPSRFSQSSSSSLVEVFVRGTWFTLDREPLAARSEKFAALSEENTNSRGIPSYCLRDIPADPETFELVVRFCYGFELQLSAENVIPLICLSFYLGMTEAHSTNNLFNHTVCYFEQKTLPSWNESLIALGVVSERIIEQAQKLGLIDACLESIIAKVMVDSQKPIEENNEEDFRPNARRKLFVPDCRSEDLTLLPLQLYVQLITRLKEHGVPLEYVSASICQYAKTQVFSKYAGRDSILSVCERNSMREAMEAVERLLPCEPNLITCDLLFEMLRYSVALEASTDCRDGFESRIGKQLDQATPKDLLILLQESKYDENCVKRILKNYYGSYSASDALGLMKVAELMEDFLAEVATDKDLEVQVFTALAQMSGAASLGNLPNSDGIYKAVDIYLNNHSYLAETEKEDVCRVLELQKMSGEAIEHAARNQRLPVRMVVQVLFMEQLKLRDAVVKELHSTENQSMKEEEEEEGAEEEALLINSNVEDDEEDEERVEIEKMNNKVVKLERECSMMRKEMDKPTANSTVKKPMKGGGVSMWEEIKRRLGCVGTIHNCHCHVTKAKKTQQKRLGFR